MILNGLQTQRQLQELARVLATGAICNKSLSVLAWGRNVEGQCGVEGSVPLVARPTAVLDLYQAPVSAITAGKLNSAAVLQGDIYTWGHGAAGKLGLGGGDSVVSPSRVEAFIGRTPVAAASLGHHHTLFLDEGGHLWACGENKEGQCGLGIPIEVLAIQHRRAYDNAIAAVVAKNRPIANKYEQYLRLADVNGSIDNNSSTAKPVPYIARGWGSLTGNSGHRQQQAAQHYQPQQQAQRVSLSDAWGWRQQHDRGSLAPAAAHGFGVQTNSSSIDHAAYGAGGPDLAGSPLIGSSRSPLSSFGGMLGGFAVEQHLKAAGLQPGQLSTPARVGAGQSSSILLADSQADAAAAPFSEGIGAEVVVGMSASKFFSLAVTQKGEVWAFGADFNGALGSEASWLSTAQRVAAPISEAIATAGGAVAVAAGGTFGATLTAHGKVLIWGKLAGGSPATPSLTAGAAAQGTNRRSSSHSGAMYAEVKLPQDVHITGISAGQQHLLLTDGLRVWMVGRWLDAEGAEVGVACWDNPQEVLSLPHESGRGITKVVAGMHSSAAVTQDGRLWLWGRLLDEQHALGVVRQCGGEKHTANVDWSWAGFGGAEPRLLNEFISVRDAALGGWHALVIVD